MRQCEAVLKTNNGFEKYKCSFHQWVYNSNANNRIYALVERPDGFCSLVPLYQIRFFKDDEE